MKAETPSPRVDAALVVGDRVVQVGGLARLVAETEPPESGGHLAGVSQPAARPVVGSRSVRQ